MKNIVAIAGLTLCFASAASAQVVVGDAEAGKAKAVTCAACHGADGNSVNPEWPTIAGQHASYLVVQLEAYKNGQRQNALMTAMAMPLDDQDRADLAAYFSSQQVNGGVADPALLAAGRRLFRGGNSETGASACAACHGPSGYGNPGATMPRLAGQQAAYTATQLRLYASGERRTDMNQMMRNVAAELSDEEIEAVASYIQGLR